MYRFLNQQLTNKSRASYQISIGIFSFFSPSSLSSTHINSLQIFKSIAFPEQRKSFFPFRYLEIIFVQKCLTCEIRKVSFDNETCYKATSAEETRFVGKGSMTQKIQHVGIITKSSKYSKNVMQLFNLNGFSSCNQKLQFDAMLTSDVQLSFIKIIQLTVVVTVKKFC